MLCYEHKSVYLWGLLEGTKNMQTNGCVWLNAVNLYSRLLSPSMQKSRSEEENSSFIQIHFHFHWYPGSQILFWKILGIKNNHTRGKYILVALGWFHLKFFSCNAVNPLRPNNDLSQTSHCNIKGLSASEVMRIENMITQVQVHWYFNSFSPLPLYEKYGNTKGEFVIWY